MVIGPKILLRLVKEEKLVEGLSQRELENQEGAGFDLRLGEVYEISGEGYLGIEERKTADVKLLAAYKEEKKQDFVFQPGEQYLVSTLEKVNLPLYLTANFWLRSTLYRSGMILSGGNISPGYNGKLSFTFYNSGKIPIRVELGARIVHVLFFEVLGKGTEYRGQWQGGRVTATKKEKQV